MRINAPDVMVAHHLPLVRVVALSIHTRRPHHNELDDLINAGTIGLIDAIAKFNPAKRVSFNTYARFRIRGAILDSLRTQDSASRHLRLAIRTATKVAVRLESELHRAPTTEEIADAMRISEQELVQLRADAYNAAAIGGNCRVPEAGTEPVPVATGADADPFAQFARKELRNVLTEALACLDKRQRMVVLQSYFEGRTGTQIACQLGVHQSRVFQLRQEALAALSAKLHGAGVHSLREVFVACA